MSSDTVTSVAAQAELDLDSPTGSAIDVTRLYRLWEANNWSAYALDFTQDALDWRERFTPVQRKAARWNYALFLHGEEAVARTLAPFVGAVLTQEQRVFLTTQIVDEARHHVFFTRFFQEVIQDGHDLASTLDAARPELTWGFRQLFGELDRITDRLRRRPNDQVLLAQSIATYHLVVEGALAHPGQHFIRAYLDRMGMLPGLAAGLVHVARDESRHMAFGVQVLSELCAASRATRNAVIYQLNKILPWSLSLFVSPELGDDAVRVFGFELEDIYIFGLRSLNAKLERAGINPREVAALVKVGGDGTPENQARRSLTLLRAGVFGNMTEPNVNDEILAMLFDGLEQVVNLRPSRRVPVIQWDFTDAAPWYLEPTPEGARTCQGRAAHPALTLRCAANDWAAIAGERLDPMRALFTRRLRISGDPWLALRLSSILGG